MTVGELREQLQRLDPKTSVVIYRETEQGGDLFEIDGVSLSKGEPRRDPNTQKAGFRFTQSGPAEWLFLSIEEA